MARSRRKGEAPPPWAADPQYQAFESDIIDHPDDDLPRLALADWLEEHGDASTAARAAFIRLQIELASLPEHDPRRPALVNLEEELLAEYQKTWLGPLSGIVTEAIWKRGFPTRLRLGVRQFLDHADELFRQAPILHLQLLRVSQTRIPMEELAACPHFGRLRGLSLPSSGIGDAKLSAFLRGANLENLELLELPQAHVGEATLAALAHASLPRLKVLDLSGNWIPGAGFEALFHRDVAFPLRELRLSGCMLNDTALEALFDWPSLSGVETLNLSHNRLGVAGGGRLARCPYLTQLRHLDLTCSFIGAGGMRALAETQALPQLRHLDLTLAEIRPSGFLAFLQCAFLSNLDALCLTGNLLGDASLQRLAGWPGLARIRRLELRSNQITAAGVRHLCDSPYLGALTKLNLADNPLGEAGAAYLAACPHLRSLRSLDLSFTDLSDSSLDQLLASPHRGQLTECSLIGNRITVSGIRKARAQFPHAFGH